MSDVVANIAIAHSVLLVVGTSEAVTPAGLPGEHSVRELVVIRDEGSVPVEGNVVGPPVPD